MPAPEIADDDYEDFVSQMHLAVHEEAPLWELPIGAVDHTGPKPVHHGPWAAGACSRLLLRWLDADLIGVYRLKPHERGGQQLPTDVARQALLDHESWAEVRDLFLVPSDSGEASAYYAWRALAE